MRFPKQFFVSGVVGAAVHRMVDVEEELPPHSWKVEGLTTMASMDLAMMGVLDVCVQWELEEEEVLEAQG
jgi:hypothetical protein